MFSNDQVAEVSLEAPVKTLDAVQGDKVDTRFIAGSCSVQEGDTNHLFVLRYHREANQLAVDARLPHETGPVAKICTSPSDKTVVLTYAEDSTEATLWKLPTEAMNRNDDLDFDDDADDADVPLSTEAMTVSAKLETSSSRQLVDMVWRSVSDDEPSAMGDVFTMDQAGNISQWDVAFGAAESTRQIEANIKDSKWNLPPKLACDPHDPEAMAVASGSRVHMVDWRTQETVADFMCHHRYGITDLDFNPNKPHVLGTAGQDGLIKFWDLRSSRQPLMVSRGGHRHWVSQLKYNPFHDQLLLSAGTDSLVNLWRFSTISSAPLLTFDEAEDPADTASGPNVRVAQHEHLDSVYATAWGASDAWVYASAGYDGKVGLSNVPSKEKYKILL
ncbi:unnamed protein product [Cylindrotheca closterium]|uniref:EIPR1-like beta-propeller domain-containing protein n=1 Tax=Cylindrotheca closterium TaxID=2856 RepID=A0AAD2FIM7_9STRA|nr:unnamed protein product [Cylindrotheca closterium]